MGKNYNSGLIKLFSSILLGLMCNTVYAQNVYNFNYTGAVQTLAVQAGSYSIQCWGGNGGTTAGGKGGYSKGILTLTAPTTLYIYVGGTGSVQSTTGSSNALGGWNGGGNGSCQSSYGSSGGGGGGSDVRTTQNTTYSNRVIVAGGGGGGSTGSYSHAGGNGGALTGGTGVGYSNNSYWPGQPGTQTAGGAGTTEGGVSTVGAGSVGLGGNHVTTSPTSGYNGCGGGGGYYGGSAGGAVHSGGGGGSGYIGGVTSGSTIASGQPSFVTNPATTGDGKVIITELCSVTMSINGVGSSSSICTGNTLTLTTNGISNYTWSTGSNASSLVVTPTITTVYSLTALSPSNCTSSTMLTVTVFQAAPVLTVVNTASASGGICPGKSVTLTASGAVTYTWAGAQAVTNGVAFGPTQTSGYTVTGTNPCGTGTAATSLSIHPLPTVGAAISQPTICSGQTFTLNATGNAPTNSWSHNVQNGQSVIAGVSTIYTVTGTSALTCTNTATVALVVVQTPILAPVLSTVSICYGGQANITASGATNYTWLPVGSFAGSNLSSISVTPTITTVYTVIKSNANCVDTKTISLLVNQLPIVYAVTVNGTICASRPTTLTAGGALNYTWAPTGGTQYTAIVAPSVTTVYTVAASDGKCNSSATVEVYTDPNPVLNVSASATNICFGQSSNITVTGANSYTWSDPNQNGSSATVSPTVSTLYTIVGINGFGCTSAISQVVVVNPLPNVNATRTRTLVCSGFPSTLTATGAHAYSWDTGASTSVTVVNPVNTTIYTVTGTYTTTLCKNTKTVEVAVFHPTFATTNNTAICFGGSILLTASAANSYTWYGLPVGQPSVMPNVMVTPAAATIYTVVANSSSPSNYVSCLSAKTVSVGIYTNPTITAVAQRTLICRKEYVTLTGGGGNTYVWSHGASGNTVEVNPVAETKYTVTGTDIYNCVNTATVLVRVSACPGFEENQIGLTGLSVYPNPNNGTFVIKSDVAIELQLRNQLGQLIETFILDGSNNHQADVRDLANGIYFVTGTHQGNKVTQKILIAK